MTRLYFPGPISEHGECRVMAGQAHHVIHVLRLAAGDPVTLFDGRGLEYAAVIDRIEKAVLILRVGQPREQSCESPLHIVLAQGISSGERMDFTVQKSVELGVSVIQPLTTQRSVVRLKEERAERRVAHWQSVSAAACEQCGRNTVPRVLPVKSFMNWLAEPVIEAESRFLLSPAAPPQRLRDRARPQGQITLLIGPEGGWNSEEVLAATVAGFELFGLGPRVLRTETAAVAALAAIQAMWGDL
ncbi:MAG: 16S rRNA (uracil(1498)-N(3))-methyltransferase [Betaproteobacteria bacterium]